MMTIVIKSTLFPTKPILLCDLNSSPTYFKPETIPMIVKIIATSSTTAKSIANNISATKREAIVVIATTLIAKTKILNDFGFFAIIYYSIFLASFQNTSISAKEQSAKALP